MKPYIAIDGNLPVEDIAALAQQYPAKPINKHSFKIIENVDVSLSRAESLQKIDEVLEAIKPYPLVKYGIRTAEVRRALDICQQRKGIDIQLVDWDKGGMETLKRNMHPDNNIYGLFTKDYFENMIFKDTDCVATKLLEISKNFASYGGVVFDGGNKRIVEVLPQVSEKIASGVYIGKSDMITVLHGLWENMDLSVMRKLERKSSQAEVSNFLASIRKTFIEGQYAA